jgi:hypothetical protein
MTEIQYVARRHPMATLAARNDRARSLLAAFAPAYQALAATADRAVEMALELRSAATSAAASWPSSPGEVTDDWLNGEVNRRLRTSDTDIRIEVLRQLEFSAREDAIEEIENNVDGLINGLAGQLRTLVDEVSGAVDDLGVGVGTAAQAIEAGKAEAWKTISASIAPYTDVRNIQRTLYRCDQAHFDGLRCGDNPSVNDPEARLYFHRNIDTVAPNWKGSVDSNNISRPSEIPWPDDPTERMVWFIRNDSGIWCPSPQQIRARLAEVPEPAAEPEPILRGIPIVRNVERAHPLAPNVTKDQSAHGFSEEPIKPHLLRR